jgi:glutathione reductase (NADPH)
VPSDDVAFDMARWQAAKTAETTRLEGVYRSLLTQSGVEIVEGHGRFVDAHTIAVGSRKLSARHILIATGASPVRDVIPGTAGCATSDDLLDLAALPEGAALIGGGYIAVEFASMFARLGVKVSLLYRDRLPLRGFDEDLRTRLATALTDSGVELMPGQVPLRVDGAPGAWRLALPDGASLSVPWVLNATGRRPNTDGLGLETIGVATDANCAVQVDAMCHSTLPHVLAIGDVTNRKNLTPVAIAEGRAIADRLFGGAHDACVDLRRVATGVFTLPPIGTIGPSERELAADKVALRVYEADFKPMRHTFTGRSERCYMKLLVDDASDRVRAVHMIGADAPEIVQSLAVALSAGATKAHFDATIAVHPTAAEEFVLLRTLARKLN